MMVKLVDTHFHLDYYRNHRQLYKIINELEQYTLCMTSSPGIYMSCRKLYQETEYIKFALGFHPCERSLSSKDFSDFIILANQASYIGEVGMDFSSDTYISKSLQIGYFKKIVEKIRLNRSDISWVGIKISGTNAVIEIVEADKAPNVINKDDYCNIVANKDAMIVSANAQNGTLQVKEGDVVKQGSVLIAGWLEGKYTGVRYVHATGQVMAKVWYSKKEKVYYKQNERKQTGNVEKKYSINIKNFAINFYKKLSKFEIYDTINTEKKLRISSNFYLPFELIVKENHEVIEEEKNYSKDEAKQIGIDNISKELKSQINNEKDIVNEYINTNESEEYIEVEVIYEVLENIGTEEKIAL